jgi:hypothetical protein
VSNPEKRYRGRCDQSRRATRLEITEEQWSIRSARVNRVLAGLEQYPKPDVSNAQILLRHPARRGSRQLQSVLMSTLALSPTSLTDLFGTARPSLWVTRERPKIDRIACPWLVLRFIDADAKFLYVPKDRVFETALETGAVAYDIDGAPFSHVGALCSFDAFISRFALSDPGLDVLAPIVRGADTDRHELASEAAGLHALSIGLSLNFEDDHALLAQGLVLYDALYSWAIKARRERHTWTPEPLQKGRS